jgi:hypothetical protein
MPFNGTGFTQSYSGHATDVVGYAWNTEDWCPRCVLGELGFATTGPVRPGAVLESEIEIYAAENGLDPATTDVPQPIFNGDDALEGDGSGRSRRCCRCHELLVETDEEPEEE